MGSSRLPGKTMADLVGRPSLAHIVDRLTRVPALDGIVVATTERGEDDVIRACAAAAGVPCFSGSADDVLDRTLRAARSVGARTIVQITGDCPLIDPAVVDRVIARYREERPDYAANVIGERLTFPAGLSVEVFATDLLAEVAALTDDPRDREHVSIHIYEHPERYRLLEVEATGAERRPDLWLTLDTEDDLRGIRAIYEALFPSNPQFGYREILDLCARRPEIAALNRTPRAA
jgi:spore coat polysaccharide biosynthesis protein SpsF